MLSKSLNTGRISWSLLLIACFTAALTLSTWIHVHPGLFFAFVLLAAGVTSASGSYLQSSVVALASLFGHEAMQAVMSGQAAVGVAVSGVQVLSAAASTHRIAPPSPQSRDDELVRTPEETSASLFFALSTVFLFVTYVTHVWLKSLPAYKAIIARQRSHGIIRLPSDSLRSPDETRGHSSGEAKGPSGKVQMFRLGRINLPYNLAVGYVFMVTLVRHLVDHPSVYILTRDNSPSSRRSRYRSSRPTRAHTRSSSARSTSSSTMSVTSAGARCARYPAYTCGPHGGSSHSRSRARSSSPSSSYATSSGPRRPQRSPSSHPTCSTCSSSCSSAPRTDTCRACP